MNTSRTSISSLVWLVPLVFFLAAAIYIQTYGFSYISWDDPEMVFKNRDVRNFDIGNFFRDHYVGNYLPLTMVFHAVAWALFKASAGWHHLFSVLIHLINCFLVLRLGMKIFTDRFTAICGLLLFALHPLQVEAVAWIGELKTLTFSTFFLLSFFSYVKWFETKQLSNYVLSVVFAVLSLLCKPAAVVLPLVFLLYEYCFEGGRIEKKKVSYFIPYFLAALLIGYVTVVTQQEDRFINYSHMSPIHERIILAGYALFNYLRMLIVPFGLSVIYSFPEMSGVVVATGLAMLAATIFLFVHLVRRGHYWTLFFVGFMVICLLPVLQLYPFGEVLYADRYMYLPLMAAGWMLGHYLGAHPRLAVWVTGGLAMGYGALSYQRTEKWENAMVLYADVIKKFPNEYVALNSLGVECMYKNSDRTAEYYFNRAIASKPENYKSYYNKGLLYLKNMKTKEARQLFDKALSMRDYSKTFAARASAYLMEGDLVKARKDANAALDRDIHNAKAHYVLGNCDEKEGKEERALGEFNVCLEIKPEEPEYYFSRAIIYGKLQRYQDCLADLEKALILKPEMYEAFYWKAVAKANLRQSPCEDLKTAIRHGYEPAQAAYNKYCQ